MKEHYVYILTNHARTLYTGVTNDLVRRLSEHLEKRGGEFTRKYNLTKLVYFDTYSEIDDAIAREKEIKGWRREKKLNLIAKENPHWIDLRECL